MVPNRFGGKLASATPPRVGARQEKAIIESLAGGTLKAPAVAPAITEPRPPSLEETQTVLAVAKRDDAVSTALVDDSHFAGSITVWRGPRADDPFARVESARTLRVAAGVVGAFALPAGPVIERHGSAQPWPWFA